MSTGRVEKSICHSECSRRISINNFLIKMYTNYNPCVYIFLFVRYNPSIKESNMKQIKAKDLFFLNYNEKYAEQCYRNFLSQQETAKYTLWRPAASVEEAKEKLNY